MARKTKTKAGLLAPHNLFNKKSRANLRTKMKVGTAAAGAAILGAVGLSGATIGAAATGAAAAPIGGAMGIHTTRGEKLDTLSSALRKRNKGGGVLRRHNRDEARRAIDSLKTNRRGLKKKLHAVVRWIKRGGKKIKMTYHQKDPHSHK